MEAAAPVITQKSPDETPHNQYSETHGFFVKTGLAFCRLLTSR